MRNDPTLFLLRTVRDSGLTTAVAVLTWGLAAWAPGAFERLAQEDGPVEWLTFWSFAVAGLLALTSPLLHRTPAAENLRGPLTRTFLFLFGVGAMVVALEEISWGQRLLGYRPPDVFLRGNFQQELNLHNLTGAGTRGALLVGLLFAFGVVYPLLCRTPPTSRWLHVLGVPVLPLTVIPGFALLITTYAAYPRSYTGEWVELGTGVGLVQAVLIYRAEFTRRQAWVCLSAVLIAGLLTPLAQSGLTDPTRRELAAEETRALAEDFARKRYRSRCGVHKRLYTFVTEYGGAPFEETAFGALPGSDADIERRRFFLDPWNLPYWIRHTCARDRQSSAVYVYSFGANRQRDSTAELLTADDVGAWVNHPRNR